MSNMTKNSAAVSVVSAVEEIIPTDVIDSMKTYYDSHTMGDQQNYFENEVLGLVEQILNGTKTNNYFLTLLRKIGFDPSVQNSSLTIANILWLQGTQVNQTSDVERWDKLCKLVADFAKSEFSVGDVLKTTLEFNLLHGAGLIREDSVATQRRLVRINTTLVYRQQKYNLFREETEGYSKLIVMLNNVPPYPQNCELFMINMRSIIGQFDLEPNRVLDVVLDVFEQNPLNLSFLQLLKNFKKSNIVHQLGHKFAYYHESYVNDVVLPVAPEKSTVVTISKYNKSKAVEAPPPDPKENLVPPAKPTAAPASLYALAATLIMSQLVTVEDLAIYLEPSVDSSKTRTDEEETRIAKQVTSFGVVNLNAKSSDALAAASSAQTTSTTREALTAVASVDVTKENSGVRGGTIIRAPVPAVPVTGSIKPPPPATPHLPVGSSASVISTANTDKSASADEKIGTSEYEELLSLFHENETNLKADFYAEGNQLIGLATALIQMRGWEQARYILNLLESHGAVEVVRYSQHLRKALIELLLFAIDDVYADLSVKKYTLTSRVVTFGKSSQSNCSRDIFNIPKTKELQLQPVTSLATFPEELMPLLSYLGYHVHEDTVLFSRLCRLCRSYLLQQPKESLVTTSEPIIGIFTSILLPALTVSKEVNPFLASQLWLSLSLLPFQVRFSLYDAWKGVGIGKEGLNTKPMEVVLAETKALHTAKADLKRLAKENTKLIGRKLSKVTSNNPMVVFNHVLSTIEVFDNLIPYIVDALKYSTDLARDCMAFCLVAQLKKEGDGKLKKGDTHYSTWFSALTKFIATFYTRYPSTELKGLLHYLMQSLSSGESLDLLVLKELLAIMGGCETLLEVSLMQLEGLSGGRTLRNEVMGTSIAVVKSGISVNSGKKAMMALRDELMESKTALPLLLFIAQIRCKIVYTHDDYAADLKLISHLFDIAQDVLMQFTDFLVAGAKTIEHITVLMPSLTILIEEVGLAVPIAYQLVRPIVRAAMQYSEDAIQEGTEKDMPEYLKPWHPASEVMVQAVSSNMPSTVWSNMTPKLYMLFWSLSYYDINTPSGRYEMEVKRIKDRHSDLENRKYNSMQINTVTGLNYTSSEISKLTKQREVDLTKMKATMTALQDEETKQKKHVSHIKAIIASQKSEYFLPVSDEVLTAEVDTTEMEDDNVVADKVKAAPERVLTSDERNIEAVTEAVMQHLIYHRVLMSPIDAIFCNQFLFMMHEQEVPFFSLLHCWDKLIKTITPLIFCTTEVEASFIGYALNDMLTLVNRWVNSLLCFQLEFSTKAGSNCSVADLLSPEALKRADDATNAANEKTGEVESSAVSYHMFLELAKMWHTKLFNVIMASLQGKEYMYVRSSLILLSKIHGQFPTRAVEGRKIMVRVEILQNEEKERVDLQTMAKSLGIMLKKTVWCDEAPKPKKVSKIIRPDSSADLVKKEATTSSQQPAAAVKSATLPTSGSSRDLKDAGRGDRDNRERSRDRKDTNNRDGRDNNNKGIEGSWRDAHVSTRDSRDGRDGRGDAKDHKGIPSDRDRKVGSNVAATAINQGSLNDRDRDSRDGNRRDTGPLIAAVAGAKRKIPDNEPMNASKTQKVNSGRDGPSSQVRSDSRDRGSRSGTLNATAPSFTPGKTADPTAAGGGGSRTSAIKRPHEQITKDTDKTSRHDSHTSHHNRTDSKDARGDTRDNKDTARNDSKRNDQRDNKSDTASVASKDKRSTHKDVQKDVKKDDSHNDTSSKGDDKKNASKHSSRDKDRHESSSRSDQHGDNHHHQQQKSSTADKDTTEVNNKDTDSSSRVKRTNSKASKDTVKEESISKPDSRADNKDKDSKDTNSIVKDSVRDDVSHESSAKSTNKRDKVDKKDSKSRPAEVTTSSQSVDQPSSANAVAKDETCSVDEGSRHKKPRIGATDAVFANTPKDANLPTFNAANSNKNSTSDRNSPRARNDGKSQHSDATNNTVVPPLPADDKKHANKGNGNSKHNDGGPAVSVTDAKLNPFTTAPLPPTDPPKGNNNRAEDKKKSLAEKLARERLNSNDIRPPLPVDVNVQKQPIIDYSNNNNNNNVRPPIPMMKIGDINPRNGGNLSYGNNNSYNQQPPLPTQPRQQDNGGNRQHQHHHQQQQQHGGHNRGGNGQGGGGGGNNSHNRNNNRGNNNNR